MADSMSDFDKKVFDNIYDTILKDCHTPLAAELAQGISSSEEKVKKSFRRLADCSIWPQNPAGIRQGIRPDPLT